MHLIDCLYLKINCTVILRLKFWINAQCVCAASGLHMSHTQPEYVVLPTGLNHCCGGSLVKNPFTTHSTKTIYYM